MFKKCFESAKISDHCCIFSPEYLEWQAKIASGYLDFTLCFLIMFCRGKNEPVMTEKKGTNLESVMTRICIMCLEQRLLSFLTLQLAQLPALTRWRAGPLAYSLPCRSKQTGSLSHVRVLADSFSDASRWRNKHSNLSLSVRVEVPGCSGCLMGLHCQITGHHIIQQN